MKWFLINSLKFIVSICVVLFVIQYSLDFLLKKSNNCKYIIWNSIFEGNIAADIAIIGNSRAEAHYNPEVLKNNTTYKTFNFGESGSPINLLTAKWDSYLLHNKKPKLLIIDVDYNFLGTAKNLYTKWQYLPFYNEPTIKKLRKSLNTNYFLDTYLPSYKYKGYKLKHFNEMLFSNVKTCETFVNGFSINNSKWNNNEWQNFKNRVNREKPQYNFLDIYSEGISNLRKLVLECKKQNINVIFVWSPQYIGVHNYNDINRRKIDSTLKTISKEYKIRYFNFDNDLLSNLKQNFYNHSHLNYNGSSKFSKQISDSINLYFKL